MNTKNKKLLTTTLTVAAFLLNAAPAYSITDSDDKIDRLVTTTAQQEALAKGLEGKCSCDDCK